jgi:hypothetical protein
MGVIALPAETKTANSIVHGRHAAGTDAAQGAKERTR